MNETRAVTTGQNAAKHVPRTNGCKHMLSETNVRGRTRTLIIPTVPILKQSRRLLQNLHQHLQS